VTVASVDLQAAGYPGSPPRASHGRPVIVIERTHGWVPINWRELWQYRELLFFLAWRDVKVRYRQTAAGAAWAILQPFLTMVVFTLVFGKLAKIPSDGLPYPIFAYCALLPWQLFARALTGSGNSLVGSQHLIKKVYFPRLIIPLSAALGGLVDFGAAFVILAGFMVVYGVVPGLAVVTLPFFVVLAMTSALAAGIWLSALNVRFRDVRYTMPFLTQLWLFVTPVAYPASLVPEPWRTVLALNPMTGVVEGFRWALLGRAHAPWTLVTISVVVVVVTLIGGLYWFRRAEKTFADVV
jgi:lipopolysaccharide transport system permease protein